MAGRIQPPASQSALDTQLNIRDPFQQWQVVDVQFPPTANTDLVIRHNLAIDDPRDVHYRVIKQFTNGTVYESVAAGAKKWTDNYLVLRSDTPNWTGRLLLGTLNRVEDFDYQSFDIPEEPFCCSEDSSGSGVDGEECQLFGTTDPLLVCPSAAAGITLTPPGTAYGNTSWGELTSATDGEWILAAVIPTAGTKADLNFFEVDIAVGPSGNEFVIATVQGMSGSNNGGSADNCNSFVLPIAVDAIPSGSRVSCRLRQASTDTTAWKVAIQYYKKPLVGTVPTTVSGQEVWPSGAPTTVTTSSTAWANSSWYELVGTTGSAWFLSGLMVRGDRSTEWEVDVGVGTAGNEEVITTLRGFEDWFFAGNAWQSAYFFFPFRPLLAAIPSGSRVAVRVRKAAASATNFYIKASFYRERVRSMVTAKPSVVFPAAADAMSVVSGNGTWGDWTEIFSATTEDIAIQYIIPFVYQGHAYGQIGIGAAGTEVPIIQYAVGDDFDEGGAEMYILTNIAPLIAAGQRVSVRYQANGSVYPFAFGYISVPDFTNVSTTPQTETGIVTLTSGGGSWANGAWAEMLSSIASQSVLVRASMSCPSGEAEIDIGVGTSGNEQVITTLRFSTGNATSVPFTSYAFPTPHTIAATSRLVARARTATAGSTFFQLDYMANPGTGGGCGPAAAEGEDNTSTIVTPSVTVDNEIIRWDGITGASIQGSGITIPDGQSGTLSGTNSGDVSLTGTQGFLSLTNQVLAKSNIVGSDVTNATLALSKIANAAANSVLVGSGAAGSGASYTEIALGTGLSMSGTTLSVDSSANVLLTSDPASPADDTWWVVREGTSPTQTVSVKVRIGGTTYTVAAITR